MPLQHPLRAVTGGVLLIAIASLGALASWRLRITPLAERLVHDTNALVGAEHPRPSHVTPARPGSFAMAVAPLLPELARVYENAKALDEEQRSRCEAVADGTASLSALPAECRAALERHRPLMQRVLEATHADQGGLPEELWLQPVQNDRLPTEEPVILFQMVRHAALEARFQLADGHVEAAVDTCLDALALSREIALGGLIGQMLSVNGYRVAYRACADAIDAAPARRKRQAAAQLVRLGEGFPPLSLSLRQESVIVQFSEFRELMPDEWVEELAPSARDLLNPEKPLADEDLSKGWQWPLRRQVAWHHKVEGFGKLEAIADLPPTARRKAFAVLETRESAAWLQVGRPSVGQYGQYADRLDLRRLRNDALIALAEVDATRAETGQWPRELPNGMSSLIMEPVGPNELVLKPCGTSLAEYALHVTADTQP
ncbi:hypothetical protein KRR26_12540 [Corallococcus sp. M34]|uniref:hypothetical protein n=1 Tax=Citreicoccus inhibens TaxID=2849499 RepID=UPI001C23952E|nr:hypothetical protein [Citreicoccus inhibens]MBU8896442.1 hypothetical protein [Citreicoccus inhibens]